MHDKTQRVVMLVEWLDIIGAVLALAATLCYVQASIWAWPLSILACLVNVYLYGQSGIYANSLLSVLYLGLSLYGWYFWMMQSQADEQTIRHLTLNYWLVGVGFVIASTFILVIALNGLKWGTDHSVVWWDAFTTSLSLLAEWLICRKIIETWMVWGMVDTLYVGLYWHQGIPFHAFLMAVYLILAVAGYYRWQALMGQRTWMSHLLRSASTSP